MGGLFPSRLIYGEMNQLNKLGINPSSFPMPGVERTCEGYFNADREAWRRSLNDSELNTADFEPEATRPSCRCFPLCRQPVPPRRPVEPARRSQILLRRVLM